MAISAMVFMPVTAQASEWVTEASAKFECQAFFESVRNNIEAPSGTPSSEWLDWVTNLTASSDWTSLNGIEHLTSLEVLSISFPERAIPFEIPDLSMLSSLRSFQMTGDFAEFNVSRLPSGLRSLHLSSQTLRTINVSALASLEQFSVSSNQLTELNLSSLRALRELGVMGNQLTAIDLSNNINLTNVQIASTQLTELDLSNNPNIEGLDVSGNRLETINLSNLPRLQTLTVSDNQLTYLDVSNNPYLVWIHASNNQLTTLDLSNNHRLTTLLNVRYNYMASPDDVIGWRERGLVLSQTFHFEPQNQPQATPTPSPTPTPAPSPSPTPTGTVPEFTQTPSPIDNGVWMEFNTVTGNRYGYRVFRATSATGEGISISDFPIMVDPAHGTGRIITFDPNVRPNTQYWYYIREVLEEAQFDATTTTLIPEVLGEPSARVSVRTSADIPPPTAERGFIMMFIGNTHMNVNNVWEGIDPPNNSTAPVINAGRTMVPIRAIIEAMGGTAVWDSSDRRADLRSHGNHVQMWLGQRGVMVNGVADEMDVVPEVRNGRTLIPLRFVAEFLGAQIEWIGSQRMIVIVYDLQ